MKINSLKIPILFFVITFVSMSCSDNLILDIEEEVDVLKEENAISDVDVLPNLLDVDPLIGQYEGAIRVMEEELFHFEEATFKLNITKLKEGSILIWGKHINIHKMVLLENNGVVIPSSETPDLKEFSWDPNKRSVSFKITNASKKLSIAFNGKSSDIIN